MQNFFNPTTPLFDDEGLLLAGAKVSFVSTDTSGELIELYAFDGITRLENPMITDSSGRLPKTPYFKDGQSYKVIVERPTGVPAVYDDSGFITNESEVWKDPEVWNVCSMTRVREEIETIAVDGIAGVRNADKALGVVICKGYESKNDGCPARLYRWVETWNPNRDNSFTYLRNPEDSTGYWCMEEPDGSYDVRMGGVFPNSGDVSVKLDNIINFVSTGKVRTIYFPSGEYYFSLGHIIQSAILERGCEFNPIGSNDVVLKFGELENRGGTFNTVNGNRVIPCFPGVLHTSVLSGTTNEYLTAQCLEKLDEIIFDSYNKGSSEVTISGKKVFVKNGITLQNIKFENCVVFYESTGSMTGFKDIFFYQTGASVRLSLNGIEINVGSSTAKFAYNGMTVYGKAEMLGIESGRNSNSKVYINSGKDGIYVLDLLHTEDVEFEASITYNNVQADNCKFVNAELRNLKYENVVVGTESIQVLDGTESSDFPAILDQTAEFGKKVVLINSNMQQDIAFRYYTYNEETRTMTIPTGSAVELMCVDVKTSSSPNLWVAFFGRRSG